MSITIALAGNPNCGKTTLFNALTGSNQYVGNWPGVTVEKKEGKLKEDKDVTITDLPGIYSLSPYSLEEVVARNYLLNEKPDAILNIVDGTNIERNLYLTLQLLELGIPVVVAINMMDIVKKTGDAIDTEKLSESLGCKVVEISALKEKGTVEAADTVITIAKEKKYDGIAYEYSKDVEASIAKVISKMDKSIPEEEKRFFAIKLLQGDDKLGEFEFKFPDVDDEINELESSMNDDVESIITSERYQVITDIVNKCVVKAGSKERLSISDKIDKIMTNRILAFPIFIGIMFLVYYISVSTIGTWITDWTNDGLFGDGFHLFSIGAEEDGVWVPGIPVVTENLLDKIGCATWLKGLVVDGIVAGVGAVLGFVPQILVLFVFLAFLEGCGYMSRVAFIMDKLFRKFGLSGKSFIPMLIGTGCSVPGIMASRTIENDRDRKITIMTTSFIPCGAKLPVISLIAVALFGGAWWVAPSAYFMGIVAVVISGIILKKTKLFAGDVAPFVMELPAYHLPTFGNVMRSTWERGWSFIKKAGTIILLSSIVIWAGSVFGNTGNGFGFDPDMNLNDSILGYIGNGIKWIFVPLGFGDARASIATVMGLVAKEEIVSVFGVLDFDGFTALAGYSFLAFNLLCAPCFAAMGAIKREMNNSKWFIFAVGYQCVFAYIVALIIFQIGSIFAGTMNVIGVIVAVVLIVMLMYLMLRPAEKSTDNKHKNK